MSTLATMPVPATAGWAEYRIYPVALCLTDGGTHRIKSGDSVEDLLASPWARTAKNPVVIAEHISPAGAPVLRTGWGGGTWAGTCGSMRWAVDTDEQVRTSETFLAALSGTYCYSLQGHTSNDIASKSQTWWVNGLRTAQDHGWDGFYVECQAPYRHEGLCQFRNWVWNQRTLEVIA